MSIVHLRISGLLVPRRRTHRPVHHLSPFQQRYARTFRKKQFGNSSQRNPAGSPTVLSLCQTACHNLIVMQSLQIPQRELETGVSSSGEDDLRAPVAAAKIRWPALRTWPPRLQGSRSDPTSSQQRAGSSHQPASPVQTFITPEHRVHAREDHDPLFPFHHHRESLVRCLIPCRPRTASCRGT